jgi:hypothetical protein
LACAKYAQPDGPTVPVRDGHRFMRMKRLTFALSAGKLASSIETG